MSVEKFPRKAAKKGGSREFEPLTGNPENGDYADYFRHLEEQGRTGKKRKERAAILPLRPPRAP